MLVDSFAKAGIMAIPLQPDDDQPDILFLAVDDAAEAAKELASGLFTISDVEPKDKETAFFMRGPENAEQVEKLCSRFSVAAEWSEGRDSPLTLTGMTNDVKLAKTEYLQFLKERVTYESSSQLQGRFCLEYLERFCSKSIDRISAEFEFCRAEVMLTARPYPRIVTKVTEEGRQPLQAKITELLKQLHFKRGDIKKHGANKYMDSNDFQREKEKIETKSEVVIALKQDFEKAQDFEKELQSQFPSASSPRAPGMWTKLVGSMKSSWASISSSFTPSVPFPSFKRKKKLREVIADDPDVVHLAIVGNSNRACNNAWERLQTAVDSHCTRREYDGKLPSNINEGELKKFTAEMGVALSVKVIDSKPRIYLDGLRDDVTETMIKLGKRVNEILEEEHRALEIETFAEKITWSWQVDDAAPFKAFSKEENWKIEKDYQENPASSCSVPISDEVYKLDFAATEKMTAKKGKKKVAVVRKFLEHAAVDVPSLWSCRKLGSELLRFLLPSDSEEYQRVTKAFNSTFINNSAKIQKVERVECPDLYHGYLNKKKTLEEKRKQEIESGKAVLELELFHGTATDRHNIGQIITHGFNRSYAGKAAGTAYGQGVYFAKMSSLSHRYTKPDLNGDRTMFYCYVLMGLSVVGNPSMVEPPLTDPSASKVDRYDSTVNNLKNPTIFVSCYRDYMAFPAYVITYRLEAKYETDLVQMAQISQASAKQRKITRKEVTTGGAAVEYPPTWTSKTDDDRTTRVSLDSSSQEYKTISGKFTSTLMIYSASIQTIERIENPAKFQLFAHARELLAKKRASKIKSGEAFLELELFHGTSEDTVQHIIDQGFNRIYARAAVGKLYGAGVYFAKDSAVSYNYAQPNAQLHRRMFLCNVLIGLSTVGKQHLLEPLVIDSRVSVTDRYDTTVNNAMNPEIFVSCYRDNWAYPAYLITFV
eukprot:m.275485 g.275485  ORF g.275485 m.275485 type:complete len:935 (+) comp40601_c0_seq1:2453-5257(+)